MATSGEEIRKFRIKKLETLRERGIDPYPECASFALHAISEVIALFPKLAKGKKSLGIAGRIMALREHGGSTFADIFDGSGRHQVFLGKDRVGDDSYQLFLATIDVGDFIAVWGKSFYTKRKQPTIEVTKWEIFAKSLRPLPEKWHGISDIEERFRKRYLDLLMNEEVRNRLIARSRIITMVRAFFDGENFLEVETSLLHPIPGGALAKPFKTHYNALDQDFYLRIAPELYLKRLLIGGFPKVYEIGRLFRNEGVDHSHNPEFTSIEWYAAYWDRETIMDFTEQCFVFLLKKLGIKKLMYQGNSIVFNKKFARASFKELLQRHAMILNYDRETCDSLALRARQLGVDPAPQDSKGKIADEIYKKICRPRIIQPTFVIDHPLDISPLAKQSPKKTDEALRFQLIVGGLEIANGFAELNNPLDQKIRFDAQEHMRKAGELESHPTDDDFVEALEYGMPPAAGAAIGIDRLIMLLTDIDNIKEVILFPTLRSK